MLDNSSAQKDVAALTVGQLFRNGHYTIPIYQRNYAWGQEEIEQLIQDIWDVAQINRGDNQYFIGSLVVAEKGAGRFETIDGQQRYTTLSILLAVMKNAFYLRLPDIVKLNLHFDCRDESDATLKSLFEMGDIPADEKNVEPMIAQAWRIMVSFIAKKDIDRQAFLRFLLENVVVLRVTVPADTDLNHYFEIMNNRGEQLEKHEILKARLMDKLGESASNSERAVFSILWDACANMQRYVQLGVHHSLRDQWFGHNWDRIPQDLTPSSPHAWSAIKTTKTVPCTILSSTQGAISRSLPVNTNLMKNILAPLVRSLLSPIFCCRCSVLRGPTPLWTISACWIRSSQTTLIPGNL